MLFIRFPRPDLSVQGGQPENWRRAFGINTTISPVIISVHISQEADSPPGGAVLSPSDQLYMSQPLTATSL